MLLSAFFSTVVPTAQDSSRRELPGVLTASAPHSSLGTNAALFDRFVGTWDSEYLTYGEDGSVARREGTVIFGWILDGRALQDVWITYTDTGERDMGTSVRFFDAQRGTWRVIWIHPATNVVLSLSGGAVDDRIVLDAATGDDSRLRWSFNEIRPASMVWRGEVSHDGGQTWRLRNEHRMKRRGR